MEGSGCSLAEGEQHANGRWSKQECIHSINYLELLSIFYSLQSLFSRYHDIHIQIQSDNVSAVSHVTDMGGMNSLPMDCLAKRIWD